MRSDILVIGGGLSGLALATRLRAAGRDVRLIEARDRLGGRIATEDGFDLGPAWFWPGQPRMAALVARLGLRRFDQYATGALTFEDETGRVERGRGFASMEGSWRVAGGFGTLVDALSREIEAGRVHLSTEVRRLTRGDGWIEAETSGGAVFKAGRVVLALPPRLAVGIAFAPDLPPPVLAAMTDIPTWMAGQAKALAVYDRPFWRAAGLSGDAMSRRGPMAEIHDASAVDGEEGALFGFIGVPPSARGDLPQLEAAIRAQLARLFGPEAGNPARLIVKDWAADRLTATEADRKPLWSHPHYGRPAALARLWDGRLILGGTETAPRFGGYLEGALEAAEIAEAHLIPDPAEEAAR